MPRTARFSVSVIFESIKDLNFFDTKGLLKGLSEDVWDDARKKMHVQEVYLLVRLSERPRYFDYVKRNTRSRHENERFDVRE